MAKVQSKIQWDEPEYHETHDFEKIPVIEGTMVGRGMVTIQGRDAPFVVLDTTEGKRTVWLGAVLKSSLEDRKAVEGSYVGIKYLGMEKSAAGFQYRNFAVRVIPAEVQEGE